MPQNHIDQSATPDKQTQRQPYQAPQLTLLDSARTQGGKLFSTSEYTSGLGFHYGS